MPKVEKKVYYGVYIGRQPGVYTNWEDCNEQVKKFSKCCFKKFRSATSAKAFVKYGPCLSLAKSIPGPENPGAEASEFQPSSSQKKEKGKRTKTPHTDATQPGEEGCDVIYTDGACQENGKDQAVAGIGVWHGHGDPRNISERCPGEQTNNRAELIALIRALETHTSTPKPLLLKTDSAYSISCVSTWLLNWQRNGWTTSTGAPVKNKELIVYLSRLLDQRGLKGQPVKLVHVRGHRGVAGNEGADKLARRGKYLPHYERRFQM